MATATITRSTGLNTGYPGIIAGGGQFGDTSELDSLVMQAAESLRNIYARNVTVRFNSDRKSGGAWLVTHEVDGFGRNAEIGITFGYYPDQNSINAAYSAYGAGFISTHAELRHHCALLPRTLCISAYIGDASRITPRTDDISRETLVDSIESAISYLASNAILRDTY